MEHAMDKGQGLLLPVGGRLFWEKVRDPRNPLMVYQQHDEVKGKKNVVIVGISNAYVANGYRKP